MKYIINMKEESITLLYPENNNYSIRVIYVVFFSFSFFEMEVIKWRLLLIESRVKTIYIYIYIVRVKV